MQWQVARAKFKDYRFNGKMQEQNARTRCNGNMQEQNARTRCNFKMQGKIHGLDAMASSDPI